MLHRAVGGSGSGTKKHYRGQLFERLETRVHLNGVVGCGCAMCQAAATTAQQVAELESGPAIIQPLTISRSAESSARDIWRPLVAAPTTPEGKTSYISARSYSPFEINVDRLQQQLWSAPREFTVAGRSRPLVMSLPRPDGTTERFAVQESSVMAPELQAKFPDIRTFIGQGVDNPAATARMDLTPQGFHAQVLSPDESSWYIDPWIHTGARDGAYVSYFKSDQNFRGQIKCQTLNIPFSENENPPAAVSGGPETSGAALRIFNLAVSATGEYTAFHGGTQALGLAAVTTMLNRLNQIYERDVTVRLVLVPNNNLLIYTNSGTDPFTNPTNPSLTNSQNQSSIDAAIGFGSYAIGHVVHRGNFDGLAGGIGTIGSSIKAHGYSSTPSPINDPFTIDYVAHEMGHQFGARHSFSNCGGGGGDAPQFLVEPGSGSTIMAYAGICGATNLQNNSDAMFHSINHDQIISFLTAGGGQAFGTIQATGNNIPVITPLPSRNIPANTPFELTATATDADGDTLTYSWEQRNPGDGVPLNSDPGFGPIIRARLPVLNSTRVVPPINFLLANAFPVGEILPTTTRALNFTVLVRDNRAGNGAVQTSNTLLNVTNTGSPFQLTSFNSFTTLTGGSMQTITWNVANTNAAPINTANVNISMSLDGGFTYPIVLASNTPNDGSEMVQMPFDTGSTAVRIKVKGADNYFFDINNVNLTLTNVPGSAVPNQPVLDPNSDTGVFNNDRITNLNNSSMATRLTFDVGNTVPGALVRVLADGVEIGTATATGSTTTVITNGTTVIPDGVRQITARQTPPSSPESGASLSLSLTVDTIAPALSGTPTFTFLTVPHTVQFAFTEDLSATLSPAGLDVFNQFTSAALANANKSVVTGAGNSATLSFPGLNNGATGAIEDGTFVLTFDGQVLTDLAGNPIANPTFDFFFLNGDADRNRIVNIADFSRLASNFNLPALWTGGDFNYNGTADIADFAILAARFNISVPSTPARSAPVAVDPPRNASSPFSSRPIAEEVELVETGRPV